jgi:uncharacterized membrane protein
VLATQPRTTTRPAIAAPELCLVPVARPKPAYSTRLACVDVLRGMAMVLMALDHTRDFFTGLMFAPEDLAHTNGPLFFTRWITHFCAPVFFLLAGTGAYLSLSRGRSLDELSRFLWTRGLWLVFLDLTVIGFGWTSMFPFLLSDVLWSLGWSMVATAFLIRLPVRWIAIFGATLIATHDLLDRVKPASLGRFAGFWMILHGHGEVLLQPGRAYFFVLFPLIPWLGVMALGYSLGALIEKKEWRKPLFLVGLVLLASFLLLRLFHGYGNSHRHLAGVAAGRWRIEPTLTLTIASFFNTLEYPPSLQFLLMTLGPTLMALAWLGRVDARSWVAKSLGVFGRVPLFFYILHIYIIRTLAVYTAIICKQRAAWLVHGGFMLNLPPPGYGHGLPFIYAMWLGAVLFMYPLCWGFMRLKQNRPEWVWLRYL